MGNQFTTIKNETNADFYVMSFNDADLVYSQYYMIKRCPAGQTIDIGTGLVGFLQFYSFFSAREKECLAGDAIKIGIAFYIDDGNLITLAKFDFFPVK